MKLKKLFTAVAVPAVAAAIACSFAACSDEEADYYVYMPDGAPALSMAMLLSEDMGFGSNVYYEVVDSSTIQTYVTGDSPAADVCILPVNQAAQLLGTGEAYQMLGTVTHGNLYILSKTDDTEITSDNIEYLVGKSVGVINLTAVPGLTFKTILKNANIESAEVTTSTEESESVVNLYALSAANEVSATNYDYYVLPEPAATTLSNNQNLNLHFSGSLQELYGSENGYPQAVMVAKTSVIESDPQFISDMIAAVKTNSTWLEVADVSTVVGAVTSHLTEGMEATFTAANLNSQVIKNCAINFVAAADCHNEVVEFLQSFSAVAPAGTEYKVSDEFFYGYTA